MSLSYSTRLLGRRVIPVLSRSVHSTPVANLPPGVRRVPVPVTKPASPSKSASTAAEPPIATEFDDVVGVMTSPAPSSVDVEPSPPLSSFPNDSYRSLPSAEGMVFPGETAPTDWTTSFAGLSAQPFDKEIGEKLMAPLNAEEIEIKPDGLLYYPEIRYRRRLNQAFGPGGWGLAPRGDTHVTKNMVTREWGLVCLGRLVAVARGEQEYFGPDGIATATEACKSNAMLRCCKDLGIASELWDPTFIRKFKDQHCVEVFAEHATTKKKKKLWRRKDAPKLDYPWKEGK